LISLYSFAELKVLIISHLRDTFLVIAEINFNIPLEGEYHEILPGVLGCSG
jgi:hypothetical protein